MPRFRSMRRHWLTEYLRIVRNSAAPRSPTSSASRRRRGGSSARSTPATRSRSSSRPWRARPTSSSTGRARSPSCTTRANTTPWSPRGEQVTCGLLALALQALGVDALVPGSAGRCRSAPTACTAGPHRGASTPADAERAHGAGRRCRWSPGSRASAPDNRITTLGRGGSDTSAVALAAALKAERCDIYTDVDGVYTTDPRIVAKARKLDKITYEEMLEMASLGRQGAADPLGRAGDEPRRARAGAVELRPMRPARLVVDEDEIVEKQVLSAASPIAATRQDHAARRRRPARRRRRDLRPARRRRRSMST